MADTLIIRDARDADADAIDHLLGELGYPDIGKEEVARKLHEHRRPGYLLLVGEMQGQTIAFITLHWYDLLHHHGSTGRITSFCVDQRYRSTGIGLKMLTEAERFLFAQGCETVEVTSNARRDRAHRFYLKNGYLEVSKHFVKRRK